MSTELSTQDKIYILDSKIRFANEQIYNYDVDLAMGAAEPESVDGQQRYQDIAKFRANALSNLEVLTALRAELLASQQ